MGKLTIYQILFTAHGDSSFPLVNESPQLTLAAGAGDSSRDTE